MTAFESSVVEVNQPIANAAISAEGVHSTNPYWSWQSICVIEAGTGNVKSVPVGTRAADRGQMTATWKQFT